jgi:hypothetical protein
MSGIRSALMDLTGLLLGRETAAAACPESSFWQYRCAQGHNEQRRRCQNTASCTTVCAGWQPTGNYC